MATPYIGEIRAGGFNFAPVGYMPCDGRLLSIADYAPLFSLIGTTFGGDGVTTFGLPDLRGRVPVHFSGTTPIGESAGSESVTLTTAQLPTHPHAAGAGGNGTAATPAGNLPGTPTTGELVYLQAGAAAPFAGNAVGPTGGNQPHNNLMPFQVINYIIAVEGVFPSRT